MKWSSICRCVFYVGVVHAAAAQGRAFTVADDIAMTRFSDPAPFVTETQSAERSPDGRYFAIVTTRGLLASDLVESAIVLFDRNEVRQSLETPSGRLPRPRMIASIDSFPHREEPFAYAAVIKDLRWSSGSSWLYFRGENLQGTYQLYRVAVNGGAPKALSPPADSVTQYDFAGSTVVYRAWSLERERLRRQSSSGDPINADAMSVTGYPLADILFPDRDSNIVPKETTLWAIREQRGKPRARQVPGSAVFDLTYLTQRLHPVQHLSGRQQAGRTRTRGHRTRCVGVLRTCQRV